MIDDVAMALPRGVWTVATLVREVADLVASRLSACAVRGEISGWSRAASGHCYFSLKDADGGGALVRCAMFRRAASLLAFDPADGQLVEVRGRLGIYEPRGELQLVAESMQRAGEGALYEQFLRIKARLEAEGLFDLARKRAIPSFLQTIGVVTSLGAAALHDVLSALARRVPHVSVIVYPSAVQGVDAPPQLVEAIRLASARGEIDALIVCRGGGSMEDLWAFNDERVVRAIAAAAVPVVSGVGHETDLTLADFAADLRAPTPTAAAELIATERAAQLQRLNNISQALQRRMRDALQLAAQRLDRSALRLARPGQGLRERADRLSALSHRLVRHVPRAVQLQRGELAQRERELRYRMTTRAAADGQRLEALHVRLRALDPHQVLARGYAWLTDREGVPVISARRIDVGAPLKAVLSDGTADVLVVGVSERLTP